MDVSVRMLNTALRLACWGLVVARILNVSSLSWWWIAGSLCFAYFIFPQILLLLAKVLCLSEGALEWFAQAEFETGVKHFDAGNTSEALQAFERGLAALPSHPPLLHNRGIALFALGRQSEALQVLESALESAPTQVDILATYASFLAEAGRPQDALKHHAQCLAIEPTAPRFLSHARTLIQLGHFEWAVDSLELALALDPELPWGMELKAVALGRSGRHEDALRAFQQIVVTRPRDPIAFLNAGKALSHLGRHEAALVYVEKSLELDPMNAGAWNDKGCSLYKLGHLGGAAEAYRRCLQIEPQHEGARRNLAQIPHP